jgi:MFS family permease
MAGMEATDGLGAFTANERRIVHFTGFGHAATHYVELVYPTLAVALAAETGLPLADVLSWSFAGYLLFGLGALPAGFAADRFGARRVILAGLFGAGVSALAASWAAPGWPLALCLAGLGASASCYHPAGTGLLSRAVVARGRALGLNGIYGNVGIALAPGVTAALAAWLGWRETLALTGIALVAATLVSARVRMEEPARATRASEVAPPPMAEAGREASLTPRSPWPFLVLCATATLGGFAYRANTTAQPALFAESIHFMNYGVAASLAMLVGIAGQYLGGLVADRRELRAAYLGFHLLSWPMLVLIAVAGGAPLLMASSLYVFFALGMQPIENSLFATLTPDRWRSTAYGLKFVLAFGIGSTAVWMVHDVAQARDWAAVYGVLVGVVGVLIGLIGLLFALTRRRALHNHALA